MYLNSNEIQKIIPHRYPFLLVDAVKEMNETSIIAIKNVSANEMHFMGHFTQKHVMPGVLIVEALAQAGAIVLLSKEAYKGKLAYFVGIDQFKFKKQVMPGDTLELQVELIKLKSIMGIAQASALVNGEVCAYGTLKFAISD
ncbi:beta-hydroxyacyl-ACP dehydratase [Erysipelothrix larvae]|uniref:3-hydroxyacyl-[acyl-carrier-protein] dehydratase FabZ n=1 Tax=Erysipelothrix larvae TaxID=1514105 RepID=A0A0X8H1N7_9FIRM|nr:3-hydroxyacyl-ACP dehydratase FabZ [Erysipelothrix larvae]AMC94386.1 beta-hydroxyacyl-ACP dehydratase [Erysipelothrix larvae]